MWWGMTVGFPYSGQGPWKPFLAFSGCVLAATRLEPLCWEPRLLASCLEPKGSKQACPAGFPHATQDPGSLPGLGGD